MTTANRLTNRSVIRLSGPDTLSLLERLVTNNTDDWEEGDARYGALLTPQGKLLADFIALRDDRGVRLDVAEAAAGDLEKRLKLFRLRAQVEIRPEPDMAVGLSRDGFGDPRGDALPRRTFAPLEMIAGSGDDDWQAARFRHAIAEFGQDFAAAEVFPSDINMDRLGGVDLKKGCFVGQEVVSRMHRRGNIRRRSMALSGEGLSAGAAVMAGGSTLGEISSTNGRHGIARLRLDRLARAREASNAICVDENPVTLVIPDWLETEIAASLKDG